MEGATHPYRAVRSENQQISEAREALAVERPLRILINGEVFTILMQLPGHEEDLTRGLLYTEGLITRDSSFKLSVSAGKGMDDVQVAIDGLDTESVVNKRSLLSATSCGICGTRELEIPTGEALQGQAFDASLIPGMIRTMQQRQEVFDITGGTHAAGLFTSEGKLQVLREDVGRHNAADKVIGALCMDGQLAQTRFMVLSGRVSYEMVAKAFKARIPVIAAVSAPTSMAVDFCLEWGIALFGFCRGERFTRYA